MTTQNSSRPYPDDARYNANARPVRDRYSSVNDPYSSARSSSGNRSAASSRSAGSRPNGARPAGSRPSGNGRSGGQGGSGPSRRKPNARKPQGRFYLFLAAAVVVVIALIVFAPKLFGGKPDEPVSAPVVSATDSPSTGTPDSDPMQTPAVVTSNTSHEALAALLGNEDSAIQGLSADQMVTVDDLSVNPSLPTDWMNVLLLGTDERNLIASARTDSMIICSINLKTGEVKLSSIMRDLAVDFDDIGTYNGTYRINSAYFFGGPELAMKTVNECFNLNIQKYVCVNFFGFQQIAHALGGIDINITEEEKDYINKLIVEQYFFAKRSGIDDSNLPKDYLETFGENTHLDGRQTLAYARIRKIDSDYARAERQRKVLGALMSKAKKLNIAELAALGGSMWEYFTTNMTLDEILAVAISVVNNGTNSVESFRVPVNDTYKQERRNEQDMFYDCDWAANTAALYNFIYE